MRGIGQLRKENKEMVTKHNIKRFRLKLVDVNMIDHLTGILYQLVF